MVGERIFISLGKHITYFIGYKLGVKVRHGLSGDREVDK